MTLKEAVISIVAGLCDLYMIFIFIRALASWLRYDIQLRFAAIINFTVKVVDPALMLIRRIFPFRAGGMDFSPVLLILCVMLIKQGLISLAVIYIK